jgi:phosphomethylpyrimidine synthase
MCGPKFCSMKIHGHLEELAAKEKQPGNGDARPQGPLNVVP